LECAPGYFQLSGSLLLIRKSSWKLNSKLVYFL